MWSGISDPPVDSMQNIQKMTLPKATFEHMFQGLGESIDGPR